MQGESSSPISPSQEHRRDYWAFISYSHKDTAWARKVHSGIETYRVPRRLVGRPTTFGWPVPRRLHPVFLDADELPASADLGDNLTKALETSHTLIVVCSPHSAASRWVNEEVRHYKKTGGASRVIGLIVDGRPHASDHPVQGQPECFPLALRRKVTSDGTITPEPVEPLAADVRTHLQPGEEALSWPAAKLKLIAGILGLPYDELRQRERERQRRRHITAFLGLALAAAGVAGYGDHLRTQQREEKISVHLKTASALIGQRHLLHAGVELIAAADLGRSPDEMADQLNAVSRALNPIRDVIPSAARSLESLGFSPNGQQLATAGSDGRVSIWNLRSEGALLQHRRKFSPRPASQVTFHPSGTRIAVALWDGTVRVWPFSGGGPGTEESVTCSGHYPKIRLNTVDFHPTGSWMVSAGDDTFVKIWDTSTWQLNASPVITEHSDFTKSVRFSRDGSLLATAGFDGWIKVHSIPDRTKLAEFLVRDAINRAVIAPDNRTIIAAGRGGSIYIADLVEKRVVRTMDRAHGNRINDLALHPSGQSFFTASDDGYVRHWTLDQEMKLLHSLEDHGALKENPEIAAVKILTVACSPDGNTIATGGDRGMVKLWSLNGGSSQSPSDQLAELRLRVHQAFQPEME